MLTGTKENSTPNFGKASQIQGTFPFDLMKTFGGLFSETPRTKRSETPQGILIGW